MATPAEVGKNKHRALIEDARAGSERLMRTLARFAAGPKPRSSGCSSRNVQAASLVGLGMLAKPDVLMSV